MKDTQSWATRTIEPRATGFVFAGTSLVAFQGALFDPADPKGGIGLVGYGFDGRRLFHLFGDRPIFSVPIVGGRAWVHTGDGSFKAVDPATSGAIVAELRARRPDLFPELFLGVDQRCYGNRRGRRCKSANDVEGAPHEETRARVRAARRSGRAGSGCGEGPTTAILCGADGCKDLGDAQGLGRVDTPTSEMPAPAPFLELRFTSEGGDGEEFTWTTWYVPSANMFAALDDRGGVYWTLIDEPRLIAPAKRMKPFPAPEFTAVTIGSRRVTEHPASYRELFTVQSTDNDAYPQGVADWEQVTFVSNQKSPWTLAQSSIHFSPSNGMLQRGIEIVKLPTGMASNMRSGESLAE